MVEEKPGQEEGDRRRERVDRTILVAFAIAFCILGLAVIAWPAFQSALRWYLVGPPGGALSVTDRKDLVQGLASVAQALAVFLTGAVGLIGLYFTWRNLRQSREHSEQQLQQARASQQETARLTEQGQITERFTRAIDQLGATDEKGDKRMEIRLGGIYALERIARDSEDDHGPIVEVLIAYVREHAPCPPKPPKGPGPGDSPNSAGPPSTRPSEAADGQQAEANEAPNPEPDVQAVLTVLGRRSRYYGNGEVERLDLTGMDLRGADLRGAHLEGANLDEAHLEGALLVEAYLENTYLYGARLERANLMGTDLRSASLGAARLEGANLNAAHLEGAGLVGAHLEGAFLYGAHLEGAILYGAHLEGAILSDAHLEGAILYEARLEGANLSGARLEGANLSGARLEGANLSSVRGLDQEQIEKAYGDRETKLPDGLDRPAHWDRGPDDEQPNRDETPR